MKKIIAFLCALTLLFAVAVPVNVFAYRTPGGNQSKPWDGWNTAGSARIAGETAYIVNSGELNLVYNNQPTKLSVSFSMKANSLSSSCGFQIMDGICRAGFYLNANGCRSMDTAQDMRVSNISDWHEYVLEIDMENKIQTLYVDDVLSGSTSLGTTATRGKVMWWASGSGTCDIMVENFRITSDEVEDTSDNLKLTEEYTEPFFFDFNEGGGYYYENKNSVTRYDDEGIIRLSSGPLFGDHGMNTIHSIERPLNPPKNYDFEWRMKLSDIREMGGQPAMTSLELSTDNRHTWLYINENRIWHNGVNPGASSIDTTSLSYSVQDNQWHTWKAEVRGQDITWYLDGKVLMNYEMKKSSTGRWHMTIFQQHNATLSADAFLDWVRYTPYFQETEIVTPVHLSEFGESKNITFKANAPKGTEYVDFYMGDTAIGRGYAPNYEFVLNGAKAGVYEVYAKVGEETSVKNTVKVLKAFGADVKISKDNIKQNESITAELVTKAISSDVEAVKADYYVNGRLVATSTQAPFRVTLSDFQVGTAAIYAKVSNKAGIVLDTTPVYLSVDAVPGVALKIGREYEIDYKYTSGTGKFELNDGYFKYAMTHTDGKLIYEAYEGTKEYPLGAGEFKALVTAGYAEVYHNGQFAFSFFMPRSSATASETYSGLENVSVSGTGVKAELWSKEWTGEADFVADDIPLTNYYSVEFDKTDSSEETFIFYDGIYENEIFFRNDGIYANQQLVLQAPKEELKLSDTVEPGYYRLTVGWGIAQLFRDNQYIGGYRCNKYSHKPQLIRKMTNPSASTILSVKNTDDIFYHDEDFEGNNEFGYNDYFITKVSHFSDGVNHQLTQKLVTEGENNYVTIDGTGSYLLNGIQKNGVFRFRARADKKQGKVFFVSRCGKADTQNMIGYDFDAKRWYVDRYTEKNTHSIIATNGSYPAPELGKWYNYEIVCNDLEVKLLQDGVEVIAFEESGQVYDVFYGRSGFGTKNSSLSIDDIYYEGENRVIAGLTMNYQNQWKGTTPGTYVFYKREDGVVVGQSHLATNTTTDNGQTWTVNSNTTTTDILASQLVQLPNGNFVKSTEGWQSYTQISDDGGKTWGEKVPMWGDDFVPSRTPASSVARLTATKDGKVFMVTSQGDEDYGWADIWYSWDGGESWNKSETTLTTDTSGVIMNESTVVDTPRENEVWMFGRSDSGFLDYWVSYDNGKTFDPTTRHTQLIQAETCFKVMRDWRYDDVYYAIFHYDTETVNERAHQMPRNRTSLAVSYDGLKTWEYIGDLWESNMIPSLHTSDSAISLVDDFIYYRYSDYGGPAGICFGSYDMSKIKTLKRHPQLHERYFVGFEANSDFAVNHSVIPKESGSAWIYGDYYNATVEEGRVDITNAERIFGVTATKTSGGIELKMGDAVVIFSENSNSYTINGEAKTSENICFKNGLIDLKTCANLFGKEFRESDGSYSILYQGAAVEQYQGQIDDFA